MGATANIKSVSPHVIDALLRQPSVVEPFVCCYPPEPPLGLPEALRQKFAEDPGLLAMQLDNQSWLKEVAPDDADALIHEASLPFLNLDKDWEDLTRALPKGSADDPICRSVLGVREIGPNLGYGRARYLTPQEVAETSSALASLDASPLRRAGLGDLFNRFKAYYAAAAEAKHGMLLHLA